jgi:hypothetical protein
MSAIEVSHIIAEFLKHKNIVTGDNKQLNLFE